MMIPETRLLRYFVALAEELNFTRAAERLCIAQQALSVQIRQLERELGVELFRRTTHKTELTAAGQILLNDARLVLTAAEQAVERVCRAARGELGTLRIGYTVSIGYEVLPKLIDALGAQVPDVEVKTREFFNPELLSAIAEGELDLVLAREPILLPGLAEEVIRREPLVAVVSERHPLAREQAISLAALESETLAIWPRELIPRFYDLIIGAFERAGVTPRVDAMSGSRTWTEIAMGRRCTLAVASMAYQQPRGVALVPLQPPVPRVGLSAVWRSPGPSPAAQRFLEVARKLAAEEGWLA